MPTGTIKSYSSQKSFGFIVGENGESVFFHISRVCPDSRQMIKTGCIVSFDECPTAKGMAAENVIVQGKASELYLDIEDSDTIVSKSESCGRGNCVVHKLPRVIVEDTNPDAAVELLKCKARQAGCNAILNLKRERRTGEAWTSNYKYTIHIMSAEPSIVKRLTHTTDLAKASYSKKALESQIQRVSDAQIQDVTKSDASGLKIVFGVISFIIILLILASID